MTFTNNTTFKNNTQTVIPNLVPNEKEHNFNSSRQVKFDLNLRPFIVIWEMTQACELACKHCRASASPFRHRDELTTQEGRKLLDEIAQFGKPRPIVVFTGGDPLLRTDFFELISYSRNLGLATAVAPSGTNKLTAESLQQIKDSGATSISLSIDGIQNAHDTFRGVQGSFETTIKAAELSKTIGLRLQINTSLTKLNVEELPKLGILAHKLNVVTWSIFLLVPTGRGVNLEPLTAEEVEDVFHFCVDLASFVPIKVTEAPHYRRVLKMRQECLENKLDWRQYLTHGKLYDKLRLEFEELIYSEDNISFAKFEVSNIKRTPLIVNAGNGFAFISYNGNVCPSGFLPVAGGNIRTSSLLDIYQNSKVFKDLRDPTKLTGKCNQCDYLDICGGSRSRSFGISGNYEGDDPTCSYIPNFGGFL